MYVMNNNNKYMWCAKQPHQLLGIWVVEQFTNLINYISKIGPTENQTLRGLPHPALLLLLCIIVGSLRSSLKKNKTIK